MSTPGVPRWSMLWGLVLTLGLCAPAASDDYGRGWCDGQAQARRHRLDARTRWRAQLALPLLSLEEAVHDRRAWPPSYCRHGWGASTAESMLCTLAASVDWNLMPAPLDPGEVVYHELPDRTWVVCPAGDRYPDLAAATAAQGLR